MSIAQDFDSILYAYKTELIKIDIMEEHRKISNEEMKEAKQQATKETIKKIVLFSTHLY